LRDWGIEVRYFYVPVDLVRFKFAIRSLHVRTMSRLCLEENAHKGLYYGSFRRLFMVSGQPNET
jgi:hypothetical protein